MNLKASYLTGYSKGHGYEHGGKILKADHAWNGINLYGNMFLLDVTWSNPKSSESDNLDR